MGGQTLRKWEPDKIEVKRSFWSRHRWLKWLGLSCLAFLLIAGVSIYIAARHVEPFLRALIIQKLEEHFRAPVELDSFHVSLTQGLRAQGKGLRIWPPAQVAGMSIPHAKAPGKPLIQIDEFRFRAPLHYSTGKPIRISRVELRGITIDIPPRPHFTGPQPPQPAPAPNPQPAGPPNSELLHFQVGTVICTTARVLLERSDPTKEPLEFDIQKITVDHISPAGALDFAATLTNPRPRGFVTTQGSLGPWVVDSPGTTPLKGSYRFEHADLSTFKGISGILNSTGSYQGPLDEMTVVGSTDTPNFALTRFGTAMPLHTEFHARVDATNGDTWLEPVHATLGQTSFVAQGKVIDLPTTAARKGEPERHGGHLIALNVDIEHGQIGDFLRLTSKSGTPLLTGTLHMRSSVEIPPGTNPVHERLRLKGNFILDDALFTSEKMQDRIGQLSMRGLGKPDEAKNVQSATVRSTMTSSFTMGDGAIHLPDLVYMVPGAEIDLHGTYDVDGGGLAFKGTARMQATLSKMVGGWKGLLLKPIDPFFKKGGAGTRIKVHVNGTRKDPQFGVDF